MSEIKKIPLADRLRQAAAKQREANHLHVYRLYVTSYFAGLSELSGGAAFCTEIPQTILAPYLSEYEEPPFLTAFVADSRELPRAERAEVLYQALVRPFAALQESEEETKCTSQPS